MTSDEKKESGSSKEVQKTDPGRSVSPFEEMDQLFANFFPQSWMRPFRWDIPSLSGIPAPFEGKTPRVDVVDRENDILIRAELPGVKKDDLDISLTDNTVTIKGSTSYESKEEKGEYFRRETSRGSFSRTVALPSDVSSSDANATFKDGLLELTVPKVEKSKRRKIHIE